MNLEKIKPNRILYILLLVSIIFIGVTIYPYVSIFNGNLSEDPIHWQTFGSYFGGVMAPILAFLGFIGVLLTLFIQQKDSKLQNSQIVFNKHVTLIDTITRTIDKIIGDYNKKCDANPGSSFKFPNIAIELCTLQHYLKELNKQENTDQLVDFFIKKYKKYIEYCEFEDTEKEEIIQYFEI